MAIDCFHVVICYRKNEIIWFKYQIWYDNGKFYIINYLYKQYAMKLFKEFKFEEFAKIAVKQALSKVTNVDILHADLKNEAHKIINSLTFTVPVLKKNEITTSLALEDANGKTPSEAKVNTEDDELLVTATYTVPFSGNSEIFRIIPESNQPNLDNSFELKNDRFIFKIRTDSKDVNISEEWKTELVNSSLQVILAVENTLLELETYFEAFKNEIIGPVIHSLNAKKEELQLAKAAANEINVFGNNK